MIVQYLVFCLIIGFDFFMSDYEILNRCKVCCASAFFYMLLNNILEKYILLKTSNLNRNMGIKLLNNSLSSKISELNNNKTGLTI